MSGTITLKETNSNALDSIADGFPSMFNSMLAKHPFMAFIALVIVVLCATLVCCVPLFAWMSSQKTKRLKNLQDFQFKQEQLKLEANKQKLSWLKMKNQK